MRTESNSLRGFMTSPRWFKSRVKSWQKPVLKEVNRDCPKCKTQMSLTPAGFVCYYCKFAQVEED